MSKTRKEPGEGIAKYFIRGEGEKRKRGGTITDPSRMFQLNRLEGTGQGEAGPTHTTPHHTTPHHTTTPQDSTTHHDKE